MFYLTTDSTHFIYGYMASDIWLRTILIVRKETCCCHIGYSYQLTARVLLYASSHRQDNTYHSLCYTSRGALAGTRNSSMGVLTMPSGMDMKLGLSNTCWQKWSLTAPPTNISICSPESIRYMPWRSMFAEFSCSIGGLGTETPFFVSCGCKKRCMLEQASKLTHGVVTTGSIANTFMNNLWYSVDII